MGYTAEISSRSLCLQLGTPGEFQTGMIKKGCVCEGSTELCYAGEGWLDKRDAGEGGSTTRLDRMQHRILRLKGSICAGGTGDQLGCCKNGTERDTAARRGSQKNWAVHRRVLIPATPSAAAQSPGMT